MSQNFDNKKTSSLVHRTSGLAKTLPLQHQWILEDESIKEIYHDVYRPPLATTMPLSLNQLSMDGSRPVEKSWKLSPGSIRRLAQGNSSVRDEEIMIDNVFTFSGIDGAWWWLPSPSLQETTTKRVNWYPALHCNRGIVGKTFPCYGAMKLIVFKSEMEEIVVN